MLPVAQLLKRFLRLVFPPRASTQAWMILTFALFGGMAVVATALYMGFVLRDDIRRATRDTLHQQAARIAESIEQTPALRERARIVRDLAQITREHITVVHADTVLFNFRGTQVQHDGRLFTHPEMQTRLDGETRFDERRSETGEMMLYVAVRQPSGLVVRLGQRVPPLLNLIRRMQATMVLGLMVTLLLTLLGSYIAARQVTGPLQAIRNSAKSISEGRFDEKIRVESRAAEFQDLAKSLNRMSDSFREKIGELQRVTQVQNEFIGNIGHEVRNPIFAVSGYLEALASDNITPKQRQLYADKGLANLHRLNNLFNDLIEIARLEYREDLIRPSVFDLSELLEEVVEMLRQKAFDKGLMLETENPSLFVRADRNRIRQVLTNLIDNAIAYTDEGAVRCRFRRRVDKVRVEVVDTGRGIGDEHLERIFERFYRIDPDRSRKSGGTGLGLSIVKQILHAHGENIQVESTLGRGSRFWFELPYADPSAAATTATELAPETQVNG